MILFFFLGLVLVGVCSSKMPKPDTKQKKNIFIGGIIVGILMIGIGLSSFVPTEDSKKDDESFVSMPNDTNEAESEIATVESETSTKDVPTETKSAEVLEFYITYPMEKEQYQGLEDGVLDAAKYDGIKKPNQGAWNRFNSRTKNVMRLGDDAKKDVEQKNLDDLTLEDQAKWKEYRKSLSEYLYALHDYAVVYQSNQPVINKGASNVSDFEDELQEYKDSFDAAKSIWSDKYDEIVNK